MITPKRYAPDLPFPPYAHQPGQTPHPHTHSEGHSYGASEYAGPSLSEQTWPECSAYLHGVDLFNHGYYWEAHEAWESLWKTTSRSTVSARFLQGLIQLAAMHIKIRSGNERGAKKLRVKSLDNLTLHTENETYMGVNLAALRHHIAHVPSAALRLRLTL